MTATAIWTGHCIVSNFSNGGAKIVGLEPLVQYRTNLFSAFHLTAMTTDAASLGVPGFIGGAKGASEPIVSRQRKSSSIVTGARVRPVPPLK